MPISQATGTEIIRSILYDNIDNSPTGICVVGERYHIYTILSITVYCTTVDSTVANNRWTGSITGWSGRLGSTNSEITIFKTPILEVGETYVWNDKFSFNGTEPTGISGDHDIVAEQTAIAAQGSTTSQSLGVVGGSSACKADITCTFIDQNNT